MRDKLFVDIGAIARDFNQKIDNALSKLDQFSDKAIKVGGAMSIGISAPLGLLANNMLDLYDIQAKAIAQVETGLRSTGNAAGFTSAQLQEMASELQNNSLFGDEEILQSVTAQLLTFTGIANEEFERTQQASLDLAARMGGDLQGAAIKLGKALNDPIANLGALGESGIQFSVAQKEVIKALTESSRLAEAQGIILSELEKQYRGSAAAAAAAGTGWRDQLSMTLGDVQESFGKILNDFFKPFGLMLKNILIRVDNLSPAMKKIILVVGGLAFAIGPVLVGIGTMIMILPLLKAGFLAMKTAILGVSWPMVAITAGIVGLAAAFVYVSDNLDAFKGKFINGFIWVKNKFVNLIQNMAYPFIKLAELLGLDIAEDAIVFFDNLKGTMKENTTEFGSFGRAVENVAKSLGLLTDTAADDYDGLGADVNDDYDGGGGGGNGGGGALPNVTSKLSNVLVERLATNKDKRKEIEDLLFLNDLDLESAGQNLADRFKNAIKNLPVAIDESLVEIGDALKTMEETFEKMGEAALSSMGDVFALGFQSLFDPNVDFKKGFKQILGRYLSELGDMMIKMAIKLGAFAKLKSFVEGALTSFGGGIIAMAGVNALFVAGAALKGGGMALSNATGTGNISGSRNIAPSFNNNQGTQRVIVEFANGALEGKINYDNARRGL